MIRRWWPIGDLWNQDPRAAEEAVESAQRAVSAYGRWYDRRLCLERILQEATWAQAEAVREAMYQVLPVYDLVEGSVKITIGCLSGAAFATEWVVPRVAATGIGEVSAPVAAAAGCAAGMPLAVSTPEGATEALDQATSEPF